MTETLDNKEGFTIVTVKGSELDNISTVSNTELKVVIPKVDVGLVLLGLINLLYDRVRVDPPV